MESERLLILGLALLAGGITPGPNNIILATGGSLFGFWRCLPLVGGVVFGFAGVIFLSSLGMGELLTLYGDYISWVSYVGVGFLFWLSWKIASAPVAVSTDGGANSAEKNAGLMAFVKSGFLGMLVFQFVNPKGVSVALGITSSFVDYSDGDVLQQSLWVLLVSLICSFLSAFTWLGMGVWMGNTIRKRGWERIFNVSMGCLMLVSTLPILHGLWQGLGGRQ